MIVVHRWFGVGLCLFFLLWFLSGIGMMYWEFPSVGPADRLERASALDPDSVRLTPAEAFAKAGQSQPVTDTRLSVFDGRPVYRFRSGRQEAVVYADVGERRGEITKEMMQRVATAWTGQTATPASVEEVDDVDQWTVQLRAFKPLWKYTWPGGEQVYVSETTGEVVQYTTTGARLRAYAGPIPHWLYFTPLRKHGPQWSTFVIWISAAGAATAILGLIVGISVYSPQKRYLDAGSPTRIPYRGPKRWHTMFGLIFGTGAVTWAFSGMLSMDPFPGFRTSSGRLNGEEFARSLRGNVRLSSFDRKSPREALMQLTGMKVRELELIEVAQRPFYVASGGPGDTRIVALDGPPRSEFEPQSLEEAVIQGTRRTSSPASSVERPAIDRIHQYDRYYLDRRRRLPLPVLRVRLNDAASTRYYIDPKTARVVGSYSSGDWMTRWVYHGLHSLSFPWLYNHRPLWDIVVIAFMLGGAALSMTALILAWGVVGRVLR